jgi:hypothetical protein
MSDLQIFVSVKQAYGAISTGIDGLRLIEERKCDDVVNSRLASLKTITRDKHGKSSISMG